MLFLYSKIYLMYKIIIRPSLFLLNAETAHHFSFTAIKYLSLIPGISSLIRTLFLSNDSKLITNVFGLTFRNPVGLGAGFDKNAQIYNELSDFGFGFVEIGTVTPVAQDGNEKPRLFRLLQDEGIINRMGFNNEGVEAIINRLRKQRKIIVGGNIGKNKITPIENAKDDYDHCFEKLFDYVDYFAVNVSSPNTANLRTLQEKEPLLEILFSLQKINDTKPKRKPILLKIAPDLHDNQLLDIIDIIAQTKIDGVIATNTTITREGIKSEQCKEMGGLSGRPLTKKSTEVIKFLAEKSNHAFPIIGVGGIHSVDDAMEKIKAGATLLQLYTGFIYEGPDLVKNINKAIIKYRSN